jgi:hypothetical protein
MRNREYSCNAPRGLGGGAIEKQRRFGMRLTERGLRRQKVGGVVALAV